MIADSGTATEDIGEERRCGSPTSAGAAVRRRASLWCPTRAWTGVTLAAADLRRRPGARRAGHLTGAPIFISLALLSTGLAGLAMHCARQQGRTPRSEPARRNHGPQPRRDRDPRRPHVGAAGERGTLSRPDRRARRSRRPSRPRRPHRLCQQGVCRSCRHASSATSSAGRWPNSASRSAWCPMPPSPTANA